MAPSFGSFYLEIYRVASPSECLIKSGKCKKCQSPNLYKLMKKQLLNEAIRSSSFRIRCDDAGREPGAGRMNERCKRLQRKVGTKRRASASAKSPISWRLDLGGFFDSGAATAEEINESGRRPKKIFDLCRREKRKRHTQRRPAQGNFISSWKHTKGEGAAAAARSISSLFHKRGPRRSKSRRRRHIFTGRGGHFHRSTHQPRQFAYLISNGPIHVRSGSHSSLVQLLGHSFGRQPLEGARISCTQTSWAVKSRFPFSGADAAGFDQSVGRGSDWPRELL